MGELVAYIFAEITNMREFFLIKLVFIGQCIFDVPTITLILVESLSDIKIVAPKEH
jgi:hypothetical protein